MKIKQLLMIAGCAVVLSGCTESHYVRPTETGPDFNVYEDYELDEDQLMADVLDVGTDPDFYPMAEAIDFGLHMDEGYIAVAAVVKDGTSLEDATWYGSEALKVLNDQAASQDISYAMSSEDSYGGIYENNDAILDIYYASDFEAGEAPVLSFDIPAGMYIILDDTDLN
jgi:hypothetical protein